MGEHLAGQDWDAVGRHCRSRLLRRDFRRRSSGEENWQSAREESGFWAHHEMANSKWLISGGIGCYSATTCMKPGDFCDLGCYSRRNKGATGVLLPES